MNDPTHIYSPAYKVKNYTTHTKLDYNSPLSLYFNGKELQILEWGEVKRDSVDSAKLDKNKIFIARSGKPLSISNQDSISQANPDNTQEYFDYSKQRQKDKDKGAILEGIYYIDITQSKDDKQSGIREYNNTWYSLSRTKEGEKQWGKYNIPIYTDKDCTNTLESTTQRESFYLHGGESYGNAGGIDLAKEIDSFVASIQRLSNQTKDNKLSIKLLVEYTHILSNTDLQSIDLHREFQRTDDIKKHRVALTANYTKPDSMSVESFNAQKQQTYWAYKELSQTEECNLEEVRIKDITLFQKRQKDYKGETIEINLNDYDWQHCNKQIIVFAFSPKDILQNENGEEVLKKPKYKIITRGFRYDMLKRVFNGINYAILETTPTTQAQRNQHNEVNAKVQKLKDMVNELNRLHADNEPMFVHYKLDTRARIEHFFAQARAECGNTLVLEENITRENANRNYNANRWLNNRPNTDDGYNFRGRGLLHITGRGSIEQGRNEGYTGFNQRVTNPLYGGLQNRDFVNNANDRDSLANNGLEALLAGVYVWKTLISRETRTHLYDIANAEDSISPTPTGVANIPNLSNNLRLISQRINGGNNGLSNRQNSLNHIRTQRIFDEFE